jgi:YesN/AraC family two-component response regulator
MKSKFLDFFLSFLRKKKKAVREPDRVATDLIQYRLDQFMTARKPFFQPKYTIKQLSKDIKIPAYQLSAFINQQIGMNFSDYLNRFRVKHCEELIKKANGKKMNIQQLASKCGFHNRNTFTAAFKKFTGRTPSNYAKEFGGP